MLSDIVNSVTERNNENLQITIINDQVNLTRQLERIGYFTTTQKIIDTNSSSNQDFLTITATQDRSGFFYTFY